MSDWSQIAIDDRYRSASPGKRARIEIAWLTNEAPQLYPNMNDPQTFSTLMRYVRGYQLPPKMPDEDMIIQPQDLQMDGHTAMEDNPLFKKKSYKEQRDLRMIWYHKMAATDAEFQSLPRDSQASYFGKLMARAPVAEGGRWSLFPSFTPDELAKDFEERSKAGQSLIQFSEKMYRSGIKAVFGVALGPMRAIAGEDSQIAASIRDNDKYSQWLTEMTAEHNKFLTQTLPTFLGYAAGIATGPFLKMETATVQAIKGVGGTLASKVPNLVWETVGGGTAGAVQGIAEALQEGKDWKAYIPRDATIGVGAEFLSRYFGMVRGIRQAAKAAGYSPDKLIRSLQAPFDVGTGRILSPELEKIMVQHPEMNNILRQSKAVDPNGLLLRNLNSKQGVKMYADVIGFKYEETPKGLRLSKGNVSQTFGGPEDLQVYNARHWMDSQKDVWENWQETVGKKTALEAIESQPTLQARAGFYVPEVGRQRILEEFKLHHVPGYDYSKLPTDLRGGEGLLAKAEFEKYRGAREVERIQHPGSIPSEDVLRKRFLEKGTAPTAPEVTRYSTEDIDEIFTILKKRSARKSADALTARGIMLGDDLDEHYQSVKNLKRDIKTLDPDTAYFITNKETGGLLQANEIPTEYWDSPLVKQPFMHQQIFTGDSGAIRRQLASLRKNYINSKRATTIIGKTSKSEIRRFADTQVVELSYRVADGNGNTHEALLHFPSISSAQDALVRGKVGSKNLIDSLFPNDETLRKSYDSFTKSMRRSNLDKFRTEFQPYQFAAAMAKQRGYYLGVVDGKYVLQDMLDDTGDRVTYRTFDNVKDVFDVLKEFDLHSVPDIIKDVAPEALEQSYKRGITDLMDDLPYEEIKRTRRFNSRDFIPTRIAPPQYVMQRFENLAVTKQLQPYGISTTRDYNTIRDFTRAEHNFIDQRSRYLNTLKRGVSSKQYPYIARWIQSFEPSEAKALGLRGMETEVRADVEREIIEAFGPQAAERMFRTGTALSEYYTELFSQSGMPWYKFIKQYHPHIANELKKMKMGLSERIDPKKLTQIPNADKEFFFEMLREVDPRDVLWDDDVFRVADIYTRLMARKIFVRPKMKSMATRLKQVLSDMNRAGAVEEDFLAIIDYYRGLFEAIEGVQAPAERLLRYATAQTVDQLTDAVNARFGTKIGLEEVTTEGGKTRMVKTAMRKPDLVGNLVTLSAGAHIAGRPYLVARNLTQSLVTGGSTIGTRWWLEGLDATMQPGAIERMYNLGIAKRGQLPIAGGPRASSSGAVPWLVHKGMIPYKWADVVNRATVYHGMERRIDNAIDQYRRRAISRRKFIRRSGANLFGKAQYNEGVRLLNLASDPEAGFAAFKDHFARLAVDRTQYLYNSFDQPQIFRSGFGRFFGQYTSWPINFYNLVKERITSDSLTAGQKISFLARLGGITGAIGTGLHMAGLNARNFVPWNMMIFQGGPYYQLMNDMLGMMNGNEDAMRGAVRTLAGLVPFAYEGEGIMRAVQAIQDGDPYEAFLHLLSAPVRTDVYQRREAFSDQIENTLLKAGQAFIKLRQKNIFERVLPT